MATVISYTTRMTRAAGAIARILLTTAMLAMVAFPATARGQLKAGASAVSELDAVLALVSFDRTSRTAVLQGAGGVELSVTVPVEVRMFERVKLGELFSMRYIRLRAHALNQGGIAGVSQAQAAEFAPGHNAPVGRFINTTRVTLRVQEVDQENRTLAVRDTNDIVLTVAVAQEEKGFNQIRAGDTITIISTETIDLELLPP